MEPDWANLDAPALSLILDKLEERIGHVCFGRVCKNWRSAVKFNHKNQTNALPMLMIPTKRKSRTKRSLYGIPANKVYPFQLPLLYNKRCCGSSHGWVAIVDVNYIITLLNPFKKVAPIALPPLEPLSSHRKLYECNIHKVVLSADPLRNPNDYVVVAIHSLRCCLAFMKAGQKFWTYVDTNYLCYTDVAFYKGMVYAVCRWNGIVSFNLNYSDDHNITPNIVLQNSIGVKGTYSERSYLVKSLEGDLWMVRRFLAYQFNGHHVYAYPKGTRNFEVYKLEFDAQNGKLLQKVKLESLGDNVLFLGDSDSIAVSSSYFSKCLQKDSIYYTDDYNDDAPRPYPNGPFDLGVYNVKKDKFSKHYPYNPSFKRMPPPFWILPPYQWD